MNITAGYTAETLTREDKVCRIVLCGRQIVQGELSWSTDVDQVETTAHAINRFLVAAHFDWVVGLSANT